MRPCICVRYACLCEMRACARARRVRALVRYGVVSYGCGVGRADPRHARCDTLTVTTGSATPACGRPSRGSATCTCEPARRRRVCGGAPAAGVGVSRRATRMGCGGSQRGLGCCPVARGDAGGRDLRPRSSKERRWNGIMSYDSIRCVRALLCCVLTEIGLGLCVREPCDYLQSVLTLPPFDLCKLRFASTQVLSPCCVL